MVPRPQGWERTTREWYPARKGGKELRENGTPPARVGKRQFEL
jgi:hypothetical protein